MSLFGLQITEHVEIRMRVKCYKGNKIRANRKEKKKVKPFVRLVFVHLQTN